MGKISKNIQLSSTITNVEGNSIGTMSANIYPKNCNISINLSDTNSYLDSKALFDEQLREFMESVDSAIKEVNKEN